MVDGTLVVLEESEFLVRQVVGLQRDDELVLGFEVGLDVGFFALVDGGEKIECVVCALFVSESRC